MIGPRWSKVEQNGPPSAVDRSNIQDTFRRSEHDLLKFVLVIVGGVAPPSGFTVMVCDDQEFIALELAGCDD